MLTLYYKNAEVVREMNVSKHLSLKTLKFVRINSTLKTNKTAHISGQSPGCSDCYLIHTE